MCFPLPLHESIIGTRSISRLTLTELDFAFEISGANELNQRTFTTSIQKLSSGLRSNRQRHETIDQSSNEKAYQTKNCVILYSPFLNNVLPYQNTNAFVKNPKLKLSANHPLLLSVLIMALRTGALSEAMYSS